MTKRLDSLSKKLDSLLKEYKQNLILLRNMNNNLESLNNEDMLILVNLKKVIAGQEKLITIEYKNKG